MYICIYISKAILKNSSVVQVKAHKLTPKLNAHIPLWGFPGGSVVKNLTVNAGNASLTPGLRRSLGGGHANPILYSCLKNPMDRGDWQAAVHGVTQLRGHTQTQL